MVDFEYRASYGFEDLVEIVRLLRGENGCPWDREQTHASIRRNFLEEAYEAAEAIDTEDSHLLCEELGDVMLQVVFHAQIEREAGRFDMDAVCDGICKKLILRHPHIFGDTQVSGTGEVLQNWDQIKRQEKGQTTTGDAMDAVAKSLPALWRAEKIQAKAAKQGFDWPDVSGALDKLSEEIGELREAMDGRGDVTEEFGDLLFSAVNVSRFLKVDPESALAAACDKFTSRYRKVEALAAANGDQLSDLSLEEMDKLWDRAKLD